MAEVALEPGRLLFAACLWLSWMKAMAHVLSPGGMTYTHGFRWSLRARGIRTAAGAATTVLFTLTAACFAARWRELPCSLLLLFALLGIRHAKIQTFGREVAIGLGSYEPAAAALLAYTLVRLLHPGQTVALAEAAGWEAACGVFGACYLLAALAKYRSAGLSWAKSQHLALLIAERSFSGPAALRALRRWLARQPSLCHWAGLSTMLIEAAGILFAVPILRWPVLLALTGMQLGIALALGYVELEWMLLPLALALMAAGP